MRLLINSSIRIIMRTHNVLACRMHSTKSSSIALTDDNSTFVAWHPEEVFPYECTKAFPVHKVQPHDDVLKTQLTPEVQAVFNKKTPEQARQELMNITYTTKHRWFPRSRDKRAKKTPMDREYL